MILRKEFLGLLIIPLVLNFIFNFFNNKVYVQIFTLDFINLGSALILFSIIYLMGKGIKKTFNFPMISTGIVFYFTSIFLFDNIFLFITKKYSFSQVFLIFNLILFSYLIYKKKANKEILGVSVIYILNLIYNSIFSKFFNLDIPIKGDVEVAWYPMAENIYNQNYFYSLSNPFLDGYGQLISYTHAVLLKINVNLSDFEFLRSTTNVLFFLSILLLLELDISTKNKIFSILTFIVLILNSEWLNYLFIDSLMGEGVVSYFFAVGLLSLFREVKKLDQHNLMVYVLFGTIYFTKQFITLIVLLVCISLLIYKQSRKYAFYSFIPFLINEINLMTSLKNGNRDAYASNFDFRDTILDLFTNTDLKIGNAYTIFLNLLKDKPFTYLLLMFLFSFVVIIIKEQKLNQESLTIFCLFFLNLMLIVTLYISAWRNMPELESPIRYILNLFHVIVVYTFINLNNFESLDN